jgi:probable F420-dependent oxidoreductase
MTRPFRFGVVLAGTRTVEEWVATARRAETLGYATLLMPDRLGVPLAIVPALAAAAVATRTIRLGTFVIAAGLRSPVLLAKECATLDVLSGGRFELGLGAGVNEEDFRTAGIPFGTPGERVARLAETIGIVKALLSGQDVPAGGSIEVPAGTRFSPPPVQRPHSPLLVAGAGKRILSLAGREADIVALGGDPSEGEDAITEKIAWVRAAAGARFGQIELALSLLAVSGGADPAAEARARDRVRGYMRVDLDTLIEARVPTVLTGSPEEMGAQLRGLRERLGISYVTVPGDLMESFAPVAAELSGS